jgi:hypothetical protein
MPRRVGACLAEWHFGTDGNATPYVRGDWSGPEPGLQWSLGPASSLALPDAPGAAWLEIEGQGHVYPDLPTRPLSVAVDRRELGSFEVIGRTRLFCPWPGGGEVTFRHPVCPSPRDMGAGTDDRALGFGFEALRLYAGAQS